MKKIFVILFLIVGATLFGGGQKEKDLLDGTWIKEDGTTITFSDKGWEFLSIEGGAAGYGTSYFNSWGLPVRL